VKDRFNNAAGPQVRAKKKGPGKLIPAFAVVSVVAGLQAATQFFAYDFRYQLVLGANIHQIYAPWSILKWAGKWYHQYPDAFMRAGSIGVMISGIGLLALAVIKMVTVNSSKVNEYLHGSARWANIQDIRAAGLIPRASNFLEKITGREPPTSNVDPYVKTILN
jgi:type IV secretion system protein VirD4